jgi:hypothetical protein
MALRPGSSFLCMYSVAGSGSPSTTRQEAETGMTSGSCSGLALLSWALWVGEAEGVNNPRGSNVKAVRSTCARRQERADSPQVLRKLALTFHSKEAPGASGMENEDEEG